MSARSFTTFESTTTLPLASVNHSRVLLEPIGPSTPGLEQNPYTVLATAGARVYHTKLTAEDSQWTYSHWKGSLSFCRDIDTPSSISKGVSETEKHWFRLADDETGRTVWVFKFPENLEYTVDRPFFHVFQGRTRRYGFLFNDDDEAALFGQKVSTQVYNGHLPKKSKRSKSSSRASSIRSASRSKSLSPSGRGSSVSLAMISPPAANSFKHITHIGVGKDGVFEASSTLDESWKTMLSNLQGYGVSQELVIQRSDLVEGF